MMTDRTERRRRLTHAACTPSANNQRTTRLPPHPGFFLLVEPGLRRRVVPLPDDGQPRG